MVEEGISTPVNEPTDWVSSMVTVVKPNKLRTCIDPKDLNRAIKRSHYPMPTIEEVATKLSKAKVFTVLDAKSGFWQIKLEEESSMLTTFNTPFGRFRWLRMPFGICSAPEEFQRRMNNTFENLKGTAIIADDLLVFGEGDDIESATKDHDENLKNALQRARERNLKLNKEKVKLRMTADVRRNQTRPEKSRSCTENATTNGCALGEEIPRNGELSFQIVSQPFNDN